jgi:hypothetical protein
MEILQAITSKNNLTYRVRKKLKIRIHIDSIKTYKFKTKYNLPKTVQILKI